MHVRSFFPGLLLVLAPISVVLSTPAQEIQRNFSVSGKTDIPGETLGPGIYTIHVLDHLTDRTVVRIDNTSGGKSTTFLAVDGGGLPGGKADGPVLWAQGPDGRKALRGFRFPSGLAIEFVYPKAEAVAIAKANSEHVVAIDPASEGRGASSKLSSDDMQLVNLWLLSPVKVGPEEGIQAQKYQQVASAETRPDLVGKTSAAPVSTPAPALRSVPASQTSTETASAGPAPRPKRKPVIKSLPHTASWMPILWLTGLVSLFGAGLLRLRRA